MSFPLRYEDVPSYENFPKDGKTGNLELNAHGKRKSELKNWDYTNYEEDIFVGYRYYDTFNKEVSYPFGYGLSYTTFEYSNPKITENNGVYTVTVDVTNTGSFEGKEVVQLYVSAPKSNDMAKPEKELKDFAKTQNLKPGEKTTISLNVSATDLASYNETTHSWIVDAGQYQFKIGASSKDIKASLDINIQKFEKEVRDILKPQVRLDYLGKNLD